MKISVERNSSYSSVKIMSFGAQIDTGLLDEAEAEEVYKELISAAYDLANIHNQDEPKELLAGLLEVNWS